MGLEVNEHAEQSTGPRNTDVGSLRRYLGELVGGAFGEYIRL